MPNLAAVGTPPQPAKSVGTKVTLSPDDPVQAYVTYWNGLPPCPLPPACLFSLVLDHRGPVLSPFPLIPPFLLPLLNRGALHSSVPDLHVLHCPPRTFQPPCVPPGPAPSSRGKAECYHMRGPVLTAVGELLL